MRRTEVVVSPANIHRKGGQIVNFIFFPAIFFLDKNPDNLKVNLRYSSNLLRKFCPQLERRKPSFQTEELFSKAYVINLRGDYFWPSISCFL